MVDVCKCLSLSRLLLGESIFPTALQFESDIGWRHVLSMKLGIYIHRGTYISTFKFVLSPYNSTITAPYYDNGNSY